MSPLSRPLLALALAPALAPALARAAPWELRPESPLPGASGVAQKVELVDLDADGFVDLVFAHSRGDSTGSEADAQLNQLLRNEQGAGFSEVPGVFAEPDNAYVIKAGDLDGDGDPDLVVGVNFSGQSYVLLQDAGTFTREDLSPGTLTSIGDLELGDLDGDGDLDILAVDWGAQQPYGQLSEPDGPLRLWLGDGLGGFTDASAGLPMGVETLTSWSFDLELADLDQDSDLDVLVASRGPGNAIALLSAGDGTFAVHPIPALQELKGKDVNTAFTPIDLDGDDDIDLVTLHDGGEDCTVLDGQPVCGSRNDALLGDGLGQLAVAPLFWPPDINPIGDDFDAATLDFDNSGTPDILVTGPRIAPSHVNTHLLLSSMIGLAPAPFSEVFPQVPGLARSFGLMLADFDHDRREDVALAIRDDVQPSVVLFGGADPIEGVPEDTSPPQIGVYALIPGLVISGQPLRVFARVHDHKAPTRWHDFQYDEALDSYNLAPGAVTAHRRRLPALEYALGLADPAELATLPDTGPAKTIVPGVWYGESLWRFEFPAPAPMVPNEVLTWRICALDAAGNQSCVGPFEVSLDHPDSCGDAIVDPWEECDAPGDPLCVLCEQTCGNGWCDAPAETAENCAGDCASCDNDGFCEPDEGPGCCDCDFCESCGDGLCDPTMETSFNCPEDCPGICGDCLCDPGENPVNCPEDCSDGDLSCLGCGDGVCTPAEVGKCALDCIDEATGSGGSDSSGAPDSATAGGLDPTPGCGCRGAPSAQGLALALLALLARRRRHGHLRAKNDPAG